MPDAALDWAGSGAMALSGAPEGPPLLPVGAPTAVLHEAMSALPEPARLDDTVLGERAAVAGLTRNAPWSVGGASRIVPTGDDRWLAVSLARASDLDLLPALVEGRIDEPWSALERWACRQPAEVAAARAHLLGLPVSIVGEVGTRRPPVVVHEGGLRTRDRALPLVVDLTSLWAGPLCAHLLGRCGARVIKIESVHRPDGARHGPADFYDLLHEGHLSVALDLTTEREALHRLVAAADVVLEASRPRALRQLGIDAQAFADAGTIWVSITAYGRENPMRLGFGDDAAAGGGLVCTMDGVPVPAGDAIADPLTGAVAAAAAWNALSAARGCVLDVSMGAVAADAAARPTPPARTQVAAGGWSVESGSGTAAVRAPSARVPRERARALGADTAEVLGEFGR